MSLCWFVAPVGGLLLIWSAAGCSNDTGGSAVATGAEPPSPATSPEPADPPVTTAESFPPGTYRVPEEMPRGIYTARNVEGSYPGCAWSTYTADGVLIDAYMGTLQDVLTAEVLSPAIATFQSGDSCTPWTKSQP